MSSWKKLNEIEKAQINIMRANLSVSNRKIAKLVNRTKSFLKTSVRWCISDGFWSHRLHKEGTDTIP